MFGGGHVVLPLLEAEVVRPGWVGEDAFLAGYGAAQAVPGPLFTFAAYLGAVMGPEPDGIAGAAIALIAVFLPGFLLLIGALPFWDAFRSRPVAQAAMRGANAAVVGRRDPLDQAAGLERPHLASDHRWIEPADTGDVTHRDRRALVEQAKDPVPTTRHARSDELGLPSQRASTQ